MVNKVHPETLRAPTRYNNWLALDSAARFLEAKYGWAHTPGMTRWDEESKQAVPISRSERNALRYARQQPTGAAAQFEHYQDQESLQSYVRAEVAPSVCSLLTRRNVTTGVERASLREQRLCASVGLWSSSQWACDFLVVMHLTA